MIADTPKTYHGYGRPKEGKPDYVERELTMRKKQALFPAKSGGYLRTVMHIEFLVNFLVGIDCFRR